MFSFYNQKFVLQKCGFRIVNLIYAPTIKSNIKKTKRKNILIKPHEQPVQIFLQKLKTTVELKDISHCKQCN